MTKRVLFFSFFLMLLMACKANKNTTVKIDKSVLVDKIAGGWAGKMVGVAYGAPTEFKSLGRIIEDSILWEPKNIERAKWEDDLYVQMSLMDVMEQHGMDADPKVYQEFLAKSQFKLWHANAQTRKNYYDGIFPPQSGHPDFNIHADDIDFQIEADFIGLMCPGLPQLANHWSDKIGHIMNYGDGVYGGAFMAALYSSAYLEDNILNIINKALLSLPKESDYYKIIQDVLSFYKQFPKDWKKTWQKLEDKWGQKDICGAGIDYNIDAKLNGAYVVLGLLYGDGDINKTMEITTRCGQDSDCNPSSALGVLGVMKGYNNFLPEEYKNVLESLKDTLFIYTNYTLEKSIHKTLSNIEKNIIDNGGVVTSEYIAFEVQDPEALPFEVSFPDAVFGKRISIHTENSCFMNGKWIMENDLVLSDHAGDEISFVFEGVGISIQGWWVENGGKADIYVDGEFARTIDCFYNYGDHEHKGVSIFHILNLQQGKHEVKLVVKGEKRAESQGCVIGVMDAITYQASK